MEELPGDALNDTTTPSMEDLLNEDFSVSVPNIKRQATMTAISSSAIRILNESEVSRVKQKFDEEADMALAEAIREHVSHSN